MSRSRSGFGLGRGVMEVLRQEDYWLQLEDVIPIVLSGATRRTACSGGFCRNVFRRRNSLVDLALTKNRFGTKGLSLAVGWGSADLLLLPADYSQLGLVSTSNLSNV